MSLESKTVLVIDDNEDVARLVAIFARALGHNVILTAASPNEVLKMVQGYAGKIDLLITDIQMPDMDGPELAATITESRPDIKTIYMSGALNPFEELDEDAIFLPKPFTIAEFETAISEALSPPS